MNSNAPAQGGFSPEMLAAIAPKLVPGGRDITGLRRLSGGASQETWAFNVVGAQGTDRLILRRAPGGTHQYETAAGLETEAAVIRVLERRGVPVPPLCYVLETADGLGRGFVTRHVDGETIARKILRDEVFAAIRPQLASEFGRVLASIHHTPCDDLPDLRTIGPAQTLADLRAEVAGFAAPKPVFELAMCWLADHLPAESAPRLVHGDFRNGNLIIAPDGIRAVLDWELVHLGDPMEDLGWLCATPWRFGQIAAPVGGLGQRGDLFAGYTAGGGGEVDASRVRWWEVLASLRWGVACAGMVAVFRSGTDGTIERAMIARRASESEVDLLRLIVCGD